MSTTSLNQKTVRPGSIVDYTYYRSAHNSPKATRETPKKHHRKLLFGLLLLAAIVGFSLVSNFKIDSSSTTIKQPPKKPTINKAVVAPTKPAPVVAQAAAPNPCAGNQLNQLVLVSISARHLWACQTTQELYDSPVVTGMTAHADTITPLGTYHIYAMKRDVTLTGSDSTGSWNDPVSYWMPFLDNQYGAYGLHDATWRSPSAFGNISPDSSDASHGCVELPLATAKWIYDWAEIGTTVTIAS
jgi:lipoprotein-anchoring transpeptidase ErfK/SrfK